MESSSQFSVESAELLSDIHWFRRFISSFRLRPMSHDDIDSMVASSISGSVATIVGHPLDSIKVRMQASFTNQNLFRAIYNIIKNEGIMPFYRGVFPPSAVKVVTTATFFTTNNYLKESIIIHKRKKYTQQNQAIPDKIILSLPETFLVAGICGIIISPGISMSHLIKIQLQTDKNIVDKPKLYTNMFECTQQVIQHRQLHRGMLITCMRLLPGSGVYLFSYDAFNRYFDKYAVLGSNETLSSFTVTGRVLLGGVVAGWSVWLATYPFDYIKTQIQAYPIAMVNPPRIRDIVKVTFQKYGVKGFYRGLLACLIRSPPVNATNFWVYETVVQLRKEKRRRYD